MLAIIIVTVIIWVKYPGYMLLKDPIHLSICSFTCSVLSTLLGTALRHISLTVSLASAQDMNWRRQGPGQFLVFFVSPVPSQGVAHSRCSALNTDINENSLHVFKGDLVPESSDSCV